MVHWRVNMVHMVHKRVSMVHMRVKEPEKHGRKGSAFEKVTGPIWALPK